MLKPSFENILLLSKVLDQMVEYYKAAYEMYNFWKPFEEGNKDSVVIGVKINKFGRYCIGSKIFSSLMSFFHVKSSFILAKFMTSDGEVNIYPGQIQYFFKHGINLQDRSVKHFLPYIIWYQPAPFTNV